MLPESIRSLYRTLCSILEEFNAVLDPCGFKSLDNGNCWHGIPCCHSDYTCEHHSDKGCTTHSLSCLFWLCHQALNYLDQITSNPQDPLYFQAKLYVTIRPHLVHIAEHYIPIQQRASEDETFSYTEEDPSLVKVPNWYDNWGGNPWDDPNNPHKRLGIVIPDIRKINSCQGFPDEPDEEDLLLM